MTLAPLLNAAPIIQIHAYAAILALLLGAWQFARRKGGAAHRKLGYLWVGLMVVTAVSSLFIWEIRTWGIFSPIHLLSVFSLVSVTGAVWMAKQRNFRVHQRWMIGLYVGALVVAGGFTFVPGRIMHKVLFGV